VTLKIDYRQTGVGGDDSWGAQITRPINSILGSTDILSASIP
jgi:hypothetical protein